MRLTIVTIFQKSNVNNIIVQQATIKPINTIINNPNQINPVISNQNIDIVRRLTGGRALLHADEITYSYVCPVSYLENGEHIIISRRYAAEFRRFLKGDR